MITFLFFAVVLSGSIWNAQTPAPAVNKTNDIPAKFNRIIDNAHDFQPARHTAVPIYQAFDDQQKLIGYAVASQDLATDIIGYGGPIHLSIGIDQQGIIQKIIITSHHETPGFMSQIDSLLAQFQGKNLQTPFSLGDNIDGITGATITSRAIVDTINAVSQKIYPAIPTPAASPSQSTSLVGHAIPAMVLGLVLFTLAAWSCLKKNTILRWVSLISGFIALGLITKNMLSTAHLAGISLLQWPSWMSNPLWYMLMLGAVVCGLLLGRVYCAGVCPFAFVEECLYTINAKIFKHVMAPDQTTDQWSRWLKYIILFAVLCTALIYRRSGVAAIETYVTLFTAKGSIWAWLLVSTALIGSFFFRRFWCRFLCPMGAFFSMIAQFCWRQRKPLPHICAAPEECFYCNHCTGSNMTRSTQKQNMLFLILISISIMALALSLWNSIQHTRPSAQTIHASTNTSDDTSAVKKKLADAGVVPYPAKYGRPMYDK